MAETVINHPAEAAAIAEIVNKHQEPRVVELAHGERKVRVLITPERLKAQSIKPFLDEYLDKPDRRRGTALLQDLPSFVEHAKRFKDADSALFADPNPDKPSLTVVLDYHRATADGAPRFGHHRGHYPFPISEEWKAWTEKDGEEFQQKAFAEFIENRIADIAAPTATSDSVNELATKLGGQIASPQRLLELSRGLSVREGVAVTNAVNLSSGEAQITFVTKHEDEDGKPLKVPNLFLVQIPVFRSGAPYEIAVRLRYRRISNAIVWFFELYRADKVFEHAFQEACHQAADATELPLFVGAPEA